MGKLQQLQIEIDNLSVTIPPTQIEETIDGILDDVLLAGVQDAVVYILQEAATLAPVDTGALAAALAEPDVVVSRINPSEFNVLVQNLVDYTDYVEAGRPPGRAPPPDKIEAWVVRNLGLSGKDAKSVAYLIGRKIATQGIPARKFIQQAIDSTNIIL